jgi:hypothetical protein
MKLELTRLVRTEKSTIGELYVNGKFECYTLEDVERKEKVFGETAIDKGTYQVVVTYSNAFKQNMPLLLNVPKFQGIRIHSGNTAKNTLGCILVGQTRSVDFIGNSRSAYKSLFSKIKDAAKKEKIYITIS